MALANKNAVKDLSFLALFSLIVGSMMGSGVFDVPQNVAHQAGVISVASGWLITWIGVLALAWAFAYISNRRPDIKSGLYGYAKHGFGDYVGFNAAWGYVLNSLLANASYLIYICAALGNFATFKFLGNGNTPSALILESLLIWITFLLVNNGIKEASIVNIIITLTKILLLATIIIAFILGFKWQVLLANIHLEPQLGSTFHQLKSTMLVTVWDFTGIEAACLFALRAKHMKDVIRATLFAAIAVCLITSIISLLPFGILTADQIRHLATPSTAGLLASLYGSNSSDLVRIAVIISVLGALLAWTMLSTNIIFVAAKDRTMPKALMRLNNKNVPHNALLISSLTTQLLVIIAYLTHAVYLVMIQLATSMILLPYLLSVLFAMQLIIKEHIFDKWLLFRGILAVSYGIWLVYSGGLIYLALSCFMYLVGAVLYFIARHEQNKPLWANKLELSLFTLLIIITLASFSIWSHAFATGNI